MKCAVNKCDEVATKQITFKSGNLPVCEKHSIELFVPSTCKVTELLT